MESNANTWALALPVVVADLGVIVEVKTDAQLLYERLESARDMMRLAWQFEADAEIAMEMHRSAGKAWRWSLVMAAGNFAGVAGPVSRRRAVQRLRWEAARLRNASSALRTPIPCGWSGDDRADGAKGADFTIQPSNF